MNSGIAFIASVDNIAGHRLLAGLLEKGWRVFLATPDAQTQAWNAFLRQYPERLAVYALDAREDASVEDVRAQVAREAGHIDMLACNIDYRPNETDRTVIDGLMYEEMQKTYDINAVGVLRILSAFYALLKKSDMKRIGIVTSADGSNNNSRETANYAHSMSKAALHMQLNILFNRFHPDGFTFRLYCMDENEDQYGDYIVEYFLRGRSYYADDPKHSDESRLVMRNGEGREYPW